MGFKEFFGIAGAASLAACNPAEKAPEQPQEAVTASTVSEAEQEAIEASKPDAAPEETWEKSGMPSSPEELQAAATQELDSMSTEEIAELGK